jgi:hypothetical protein
MAEKHIDGLKGPHNYFLIYPTPESANNAGQIQANIPQEA